MAGYTGETCKVDIDECMEDNPCGDGGTCMVSIHANCSIHAQNSVLFSTEYDGKL